MPCLLIYGDTGMGKTKIIRKFERQNPKRLCQPTGVTKRPVVVALTPPEPIERELYAEILIALDAPVLAGGSTAREKDICRRLLRTVEARMLVLDQANDMLVGTFRQQRVFLNAIRFLANDLRIPLVCVGTDQARQALLTDAQLAEMRGGLRPGGDRGMCGTTACQGVEAIGLAEVPDAGLPSCHCRSGSGTRKSPGTAKSEAAPRIARGERGKPLRSS